MSYRSTEVEQIARLTNRLSRFEVLLKGFPEEVINRAASFYDNPRYPALEFEEIPSDFELKEALELFPPEPLWVTNADGLIDNQPPEVVTREEVAKGLSTSVWPIGPLRTVPVSSQDVLVQWVTRLQDELVHIRFVRAPLTVFPNDPVSISCQSPMTGYGEVCTTSYTGGMSSMTWLASFKTRKLGTFQPEGLSKPLDVAKALIEKFFKEECPKFKGASPTWVIQAYLDAWLPEMDGEKVTISRKASASRHAVEFWLRHLRFLESVSLSRDLFYGTGQLSWDEAPWIEMAEGVTLR